MSASCNLTPTKELGEFEHSLVLTTHRRLQVGQMIRGDFFPDSTYFAKVEFVSDHDALAQVISHTAGCPFKTGEKIRYIFTKRQSHEHSTSKS